MAQGGQQNQQTPRGTNGRGPSTSSPAVQQPGTNASGGAQGVPARHPITGTPTPTSTGAGQGRVQKGKTRG
jgi:hypothetical protein